MMMTGLSSTGEAQTDMMKAVMHQKKTQSQQEQIKARIIKLQKEEERAKKRIRDLEKRHEFVNEMNKLKEDKMLMIKNMYEHRLQVEGVNREKFNKTRTLNQQKIKFGELAFKQRNRFNYSEIKDQQKKIEELVRTNRDNFLKEKQKAYK